MRPTFYHFAYYLLLFLFLAGCRKEAAEVKKSVWQPVASITNDSKIILNASTDGKHLFTYGPFNFDILDSQLYTQTIINSAFSMNIHPSNSRFYGYFWEDHDLILFGSYAQLQNSGNSTFLYLKDISPTAKAFNTANVRKRYQWALNDEGQVMLSVVEQDGTYSVYLVTFTISRSDFYASRPISVKRINIPPMQNSPTSFYCLGDTFFFYSSDNAAGILYTVNKSGNVVATNQAYDGELFTYNGAIYQVYGTGFNVSRDGGISFNERILLNQDLSSYYFRIIDGKILVFIPRTGIGLFEFTPGGFTIKSIDMEGLQGNHITQLTLFNNKLFVSTYSGLYYKDWQEVVK